MRALSQILRLWNSTHWNTDGPAKNSPLNSNGLQTLWSVIGWGSDHVFSGIVRPKCAAEPRDRCELLASLGRVFTTSAMSDPFASSTLSLILAWTLAIPILIGILNYLGEVIFSRYADKSERLFALWFAFCMIVFSPLRYILLQIITASAYAVQSVPAFLSMLLLVLYVPVVYGLLYALGVGLPLLAFFGGLFLLRKANLAVQFALASVSFPLLCTLGYAIYFAALPYAARSIWWLSDSDVIKSTNGPAVTFYRFIVKPDIPRFGPTLAHTTGSDATEELRNHVSQIYISPHNRAGRHFSLAVRYSLRAIKILKKGKTLNDVPVADQEEAIASYKTALHEAEQADTGLLNNSFSELGDAVREKFIPGLRDIIDGVENESHKAALARGDALLDDWADWFNSRLPEIAKQIDL